jgi:SAM-dependent MidA family methyltransferase
MEAALYDPTHGFFATGGGPAGRRDFVTSPETGSLFGALVARALDGWWDALGRPARFTVVEAGAGDGRLAREVLRAEPACTTALEYVLVERSAAARLAQPDRLEPARGLGVPVRSLEDLPTEPIVGVVLANELLDNLVFDVAERTEAGWREVRVGWRDGFVEVSAPLAPSVAADLPDDVPIGARLPLPTGVVEWVARAAGLVAEGGLLLIDYMATSADLAARGGWLRTYRDHRRGSDPFTAPGSTDITADVRLEPLRAALDAAGLTDRREDLQADWLRSLGLADLVAEGEAAWRAGAAGGDLAALAGRSRGVEAANLTDPGGLGGFTVCTARRAPRAAGADG